MFQWRYESRVIQNRSKDPKANVNHLTPDYYLFLLVNS